MPITDIIEPASVDNISRAPSAPTPNITWPLGQPSVTPGVVYLDQCYRVNNAAQDDQKRQKPEARSQITPKLY